jgi:hypothetical protein
METEHTDVVVIGLGVGGEDAAGKLAGAGLHVTGVEARLVGGECPYWACVRSKMMIRAAGLLTEARRIPGMAGTSTVTPDWAPVARRIREEATDYWNDKVAVDRFTGEGGHFVRGRATITGPREVTVAVEDGTRVFRARRGIVIATGTDPAVPPIPGLAGTPYWTNREAVRVPRRAAGRVRVERVRVLWHLGPERSRLGAPPAEPLAEQLARQRIEGQQAAFACLGWLLDPVALLDDVVRGDPDLPAGEVELALAQRAHFAAPRPGRKCRPQVQAEFLVLSPVQVEQPGGLLRSRRIGLALTRMRRPGILRHVAVGPVIADGQVQGRGDDRVDPQDGRGLHGPAHVRRQRLSQVCGRVVRWSRSGPQRPSQTWRPSA